MNKNDHITATLIHICIQLMQQDKTIYDERSKPYEEKFREKLNISWRYFEKRVNPATNKHYNRIIKIVDTTIPNNSKWIPLLFCSELLGAWLTDHGKYLKTWDNWDFTGLYDIIEKSAKETEIRTYNQASHIINRIKGHKVNYDKSERLLKLKAIKHKTLKEMQNA